MTFSSVDDFCRNPEVFCTIFDKLGEVGTIELGLDS